MSKPQKHIGSCGFPMSYFYNTTPYTQAVFKIGDATLLVESCHYFSHEKLAKYSRIRNSFQNLCPDLKKAVLSEVALSMRDTDL